MDVIEKGILHKLEIPTRVYFGRGILEEGLEDVSKKSGILVNPILIVTTGGSLYRFGHIERLKNCISEINPDLEVYIYDGIRSNPTLQDVECGISFAKENNIKSVIGFGGGSALDAAKAIAAGVVAETYITNIFRKGEEPKDALPIIAIPTTAGTGSELSKAAILTDKERVRKGGLRGEKLYPDAAVVDSEFTETISLKVTMETGFDVLAHAIEGYVSKAASPFTKMLSEYVISNAGNSIKKLANDLYDVEAREQMSFSSMLMGINLGNTGTALPHRLQYPVGAHTNSSHAAGLAAMYPVWLKYESSYSPEEIKRIMGLLEIEEIEELIKYMGLRNSLEEIGVKQEMIDQMCEEVSGNLQNDPAFSEQDIVKKIYRESLYREKK